MFLPTNRSSSNPRLSMSVSKQSGTAVGFPGLTDARDFRQRMAHARHLLRDVGLTVADVAQRVGYDDLYHFSKLFKKHCGISPRRGAGKGTP